MPDPLTDCGCIRCLRERGEREFGFPAERTRMVVCPQCGNKRCPHASDHRLACTGSNGSGQPGSVFGPAADVPPLTNAELAAMRARCEAATPGDWRYYRSGRPEFRNVVHCVEAGELLVCEANGAGTDNDADAVFIANAHADVPRLLADLDRLRADCQRLRGACARTEVDVQQILGKALGCPWFKDDPRNFPEATEESGVCVGDEVAASLAERAARRIRELEADNAALRRQVAALRERGHGQSEAPARRAERTPIVSDPDRPA